ncbi:hypothetical protein J437_LFUL018572 [Ladona fulva]|uniref:Uncharacterized protein n=1 Tax=Ladona fulva TaxID=123851 RepID=A0A8K0PAI3_LADFU|nr:hypothetical protein J437_LFUL018572 [Ladona fulva]
MCKSSLPNIRKTSIVVCLEFPGSGALPLAGDGDVINYAASRQKPTEANSRVQVGNENITHLAYAGDIVLLLVTAEELTMIVQEYSNKNLANERVQQKQRI